MNDARTDALERTVNILINRLAAAEAEVARLGQQLWQMVPPQLPSGAVGQIRYATGVVPAKGTAGVGILGSATVSLYTLNASTGLLVGAGTGTAWNDSVHATGADLVVMQDASGNWIIITEFCP